MPLRHMTKLLAGTFLTAAGIGFAVDFWQLSRPPLGSGLFWPLLGGAAATSMFVARIRTPRLALPIWVAWLVLIALALRAAYLSTPLPLPDGLIQRARFDVLGAWLSGGLAFRLFLSFITGEGLDRVKMQTELSLAHDIQVTLVPDISHRTGALEVYGKSFPSKEMGGDLIDVVDSES